MSNSSIFSTLVSIGLLGVLLIGMWAWSPAWNDTGHVTWLGAKTYDSAGWDTPYAITTLHHGVLNFTSSQNPIGSLSNMTQIPLVGMTRYNGGWYKVVVDP